MSSLANIRSWLSWHYWDAGAGAPLWDGICETADGVAQLAREALRCRFPSVAPPDALPEISFNQNLDPPAHKMTTAALRSYLADPWSKWKQAGTKPRIFEELALLGYPSCEIVSWRNLVDAGAPPTVFGGFTNFCYLVVKKPNPWAPAGLWGPPPIGDGALWGAAPFTWGSTAKWSEIEEIRRVLKKWKPAAASFRFIEAWLEVSIFGLPTSVVRWPVHEDWEFDSNGAAADFYNTGY